MHPEQPRPEAASRIALPWIVRLRYGMAVGQAWAAGVAHYGLGIDLPLQWIALGPILLVSSNLLLSRLTAHKDDPARTSTATLLSWVFMFDNVCLTGLLMLSGGSSNPFTLLYLVHITLAATLLTKRQTWMLVGVSTFCFGLLFVFFRPVPEFDMHYQGAGVSLHLAGMWISFTLAVLLVAIYGARISQLVREHEKALLKMHEELARKDRLASLVTLAAGAAHELNTPLGTIAVVARELERFAANTARDQAVAADSRLIRKEVDRCREILLRMSAAGAAPAAQAVETVEVPDLLDDIARAFASDRLRIEMPTASNLPSLRIQAHAVHQAIAGLVKNALEASGPTPADPALRDRDKSELSTQPATAGFGAQPRNLRGGPPAPVVHLSVRVSDVAIQFVVADRGKGMSSEVVRRAGEPFFTTKEPGQGMGLGVFLARTLAENLGGRLTFESLEGNGTSAILELPIKVPARPGRGSGVVA